MNSPDSSPTTTALLESLFERQDPATWEAYERRLRPVLLGTARRMGLSNADADEVVQECMVHVIRSYRKGGYARTAGRLRAWILCILRNRVRDHFARKARRPEARSQSALKHIKGSSELSKIWAEEARRKIALDALELIRRHGGFEERTVKAFEEHILKGRDAKKVADELGVGVWSVYKYCQRCTASFQEAVSDLSGIYDFDA